jgi:hypothetical protein
MAGGPYPTKSLLPILKSCPCPFNSDLPVNGLDPAEYGEADGSVLLNGHVVTLTSGGGCMYSV